MLKEFEQRLNDYWKASEEIGEEYYKFEVKECRDGDVMIKCLNDDESEEWILEVEYSNDMAALIKNCIHEFYETYYNSKGKIVKGWNGFINRKVKSLCKALDEVDTEKISKLNIEMTERYKIMMDCKFEISELKRFVSMFYIIKEEYEPVKETV